MNDLHPVLQAAGITGNGRLLACFSPSGLLTKLFWPHIDYGQHMGKFFAGIVPRYNFDDTHTRWLHDGNWQTEQHYLPAGNIIHTRYRDEHRQFEVEQWSFVLPDQDILVNRYRVVNKSEDVLYPALVLYFAFRPAESDQFDSMFIDFDTFTAVQYRRDVYLAVGALEKDLEPAGYHCGRINTPSDPLEGASQGGKLWGNYINLGRSAGGLCWKSAPLDPGRDLHATTFIAAAASGAETLASVRRLKDKTPGSLLDVTQKYWQGWLERGEHLPVITGLAGDAENLYRRSLLTIKLLQDRSGGFIAAPEFDPLYRSSGGYGYCWLRDALYSAVALDEAGYLEEAELFYLYAADIQDPDGDWQQRYFMDGSWAPTWGKQIDQTGCILWGFLHHHRLSGNAGFARRVWPAVQKAAAYLCAHTADNGLPLPSIDPWEERLGQGTYSAAAVFGGLKAASVLARELKAPELAATWSAAAEKMRTAIVNLQWSEKLGRFYRSIGKRVDECEYNYLRDNGFEVWQLKDPSGLYNTFWSAHDSNIDSSLLALGFPFNVLPPGDDKLLSTAGVIENTLWNHRVGGLHRYDGDCYAGGNPWVISTLWLALHYFREGQHQRARELLTWCTRHTNHNLLLPEQVHKENGGPAWVVPLKWSHAMYVITFLALHGRATWLNL